MKLLAACSFGLLLALASAAQAQPKVEPHKRNVVAQRLEGEWRVANDLNQKLGGGEKLPISFRIDPSVVKLAPPAIAKGLEKERIYLAGRMAFRRHKDAPFFLISHGGLPAIIYLRPKDDDPYGDGEILWVFVAVATDRDRDILYISEENVRAFTAYERAKDGR